MPRIVKEWTYKNNPPKPTFHVEGKTFPSPRSRPKSNHSPTTRHTQCLTIIAKAALLSFNDHRSSCLFCHMNPIYPCHTGDRLFKSFMRVRKLITDDILQFHNEHLYHET